MGVSQNHMIFIGVSLDVKIINLSSEQIDGLMKYSWRESQPESVQIVYDGMNGDYFIVGIPIFVSKDGRWDSADIPLTILGIPIFVSKDGRWDSADIPLTILPIDLDLDKAMRVKLFCKKEFDLEVKPQYIVFTHTH